jgi:hypothetical protein
MSTGSIMGTADEVRPLREPRAVRAFLAAAMAESVSWARTGGRLVAERVEIEEETRPPIALEVAFGPDCLPGRAEPTTTAGAGARAVDGHAGRGKGAGRV